MDTQHALTGRVAVVAGATRGAGRGIARGLGEAGATVYCTGRSVRNAPSHYGRPETIEETAEQVTALGGQGIPVQVDHTVEPDVAALFERVAAEHGGVDVLVNSTGGEDPQMAGWDSFWKTNLTNAQHAINNALLAHVITAKHAAPLMIEKKSGLIVEVTELDLPGGSGGNVLSDLVKAGLKNLAYRMADELRKYRVTAVAITPGFLRSETMLEYFGVTEQDWEEGGEKDKHFLQSETPLFIGRGVAALAADPDAFEQTGDITSSWALAEKYGVTDYDGRRPNWGTYFQEIVPSKEMKWVADGLGRQAAYLERMAARARAYVGQEEEANG